MKPKAILSYLWSAQFEVVRQFLMMHEPMVLIVPRGSLNSEMCGRVADTGCRIVWLEELSKSRESTTSMVETFESHLQSQTSVAGFPGQGVAGRLTDVIVERLKGDLPAALKVLQHLTSAADQFDIKLLATNEDVTSVGKIVTAWAKSHGIPSLHLAHAIALVDPYTVHNQLVADKLAVFGERGREGYLDLGISADRIVVTGNPAWDRYADLRKRKRECRDHLNVKNSLDPLLPLIVFGTTWAANLSAMCNGDVFGDSASAFAEAIRKLGERGIEVNAVVKDRPANSVNGLETWNRIREAFGVPGEHCFYAVEDTQLFAAAADVLVAVDSNYLVEAMLADTPAINLMNATGQLMGPCFEAETGIMEVEFGGLAEGIQLLLTDHATRTTLLNLAANRAPYYNHRHGDGSAAKRVAQTMAGMITNVNRRRDECYVWQKCLDVASSDVNVDYHTVGRADLVAMYTNTPEFILDIGCAAGSTAALLKQRFPKSRAWGIEMNHAAAHLASQKLDRVLVGKFEDFDLEKAGIETGTLDAVLLADVLEHMYNPWDVMVKLRPFMAPTGQLLLSIPNARNLLLMDDLSKGNFAYSEAGLLDITHIRFFTFKEICKFCRETGYRVIATQNAIDQRLAGFFQQHQAQTLSDINMDRMTLKNVTRNELIEVCTIQFYLLLERDSMAA